LRPAASTATTTAAPLTAIPSSVGPKRLEELLEAIRGRPRGILRGFVGLELVQAIGSRFHAAGRTAERQGKDRRTFQAIRDFDGLLLGAVLDLPEALYPRALRDCQFAGAFLP